ncbi:MAG: hypothetical protein M3419_00550 [Actinomycetota bacterium]|nr:hypothetical protein [Actinomycetota bacterium]
MRRRWWEAPPADALNDRHVLITGATSGIGPVAATALARLVHSMHPGWVDTRGVSRYLPIFRAATLPFMRSPAQGADTLVWPVASPHGSQ